MKTVDIRDQQAGQRLDKFLFKYLPNAPKSFIYRLFRKKDVKVNGKPQPQTYVLNAQDQLFIYLSDEQYESFKDSTILEQGPYELDIVYEDENILICNKQAEMVVQDDGHEKNLTTYVHRYLMDQGYDFKAEFVTPAPIHRLDMNTTGLVIFGKTLDALQQLSLMMKERTIKKEYLAVVLGDPKRSAVLKDFYRFENKKALISSSGEAIETRYRLLSSTHQYHLLLVELVTGKKHQIRAHLSYHGLKIVGDVKYGIKSNQTQCLHAYRLTFNGLEGKMSYLNGKVFTCIPDFGGFNVLVSQIGNKGVV